MIGNGDGPNSCFIIKGNSFVLLGIAFGYELFLNAVLVGELSDLLTC